MKGTRCCLKKTQITHPQAVVYKNIMAFMFCNEININNYPLYLLKSLPCLNIFEHIHRQLKLMMINYLLNK